MKSQRIVLASRPDGVPKTDNFRLEEAELGTPGPGQFAVRVIWLSLDPYMRGRMDDAESYARPVEVGATMEAQAVGQVTASDNSDYAVGDIVLGPFGWTSAALSDGTGCRKVDPKAAPISTALGVLGMPGFTAWVGLNDIAGAAAGETILVSAATGAVGATVGQLAKAKGLRVIGVAGGPDKCAFATGELGFDTCIDHRSGAKAMRAAINEAAPGGIDIYYENVGGDTLAAVLPNLKDHARIALCGMIAWYSGQNLDAAISAPAIWRSILVKRLNVRGFIIFDHNHRFPDFIAEVAPMVRDGRIAYRETITEGLENAPEAFLGLLRGRNFGKQLVRVGPDPDKSV